MIAGGPTLRKQKDHRRLPHKSYDQTLEIHMDGNGVYRDLCKSLGYGFRKNAMDDWAK